MTCAVPAPGPMVASPRPTVATVGVTAYGCGAEEAALFRELAPRLGIRPTITEAAVSAATVALARGNACISVGHKSPITAPTLRALREAGVRYISSRSIGCNHIDLECAASLGLRVETVVYSPDSVADYTLMLLLMVLRHAGAILGRAAAGDYRQNEASGRELRDLTVGIVGAGRIGTAVIRRLQGFGCRILACVHHPRPRAADVSLDELLRRCDVVTLHLPLDAGTHHLLDRQRLARMRRGAVLVNTGRGALVDTEALVAALESGHLGGAALDVLEGEEGVFYTDCRDRPMARMPLVRLRGLPNVVISPHTAYHTDHALRDAVRHSLARCLEFERRPPHG